MVPPAFRPLSWVLPPPLPFRRACSVHRACSQAFCRKLDRVTVKGSKTPMALYTPDVKSIRDREDYNEAVNQYIDGRWEQVWAHWLVVWLCVWTRSAALERLQSVLTPSAPPPFTFHFPHIVSRHRRGA